MRMRATLVALMGCCVWSCVAAAAGQADVGALHAEALSGPLGGGLVIVGSPVEGEQRLAQRAAELSNPVAVAQREASRTKFSGLDAAQAAKLAGESFPVLVEQLAGGLPKMASVARVTGFPSDNAASIALADGRHGLLESLDPIAVKAASGRRVAIDLSLHEAGGVFEPVMPLVDVRIPRRVGEGIQLGGSGISVTPVSGSSSVVGDSEGVLTGASIFYANTQSDTDTVVKPTTSGFEASAVLRSAQSPERIAYRVSMPIGARLVQNRASGIVHVVKDGVPVAGVLPPSATDADGANVPVSMSVNGDLLTLAVHRGSGKWDYPIAVDPYYYITDSYKGGIAGFAPGWVPKTTSSAWKIEDTDTEYIISQTAAAPANSTALINYSTQGESHIDNLTAKVTGPGEKGTLTFLRIFKPTVEQEEYLFPKNESFNQFVEIYGHCWKTECNSVHGEEKGAEENTAEIGIETTAEVPCCQTPDHILQDEVLIWQEHAPEAHLDIYHSKLLGTNNVFDEAGGWIGPNSGAFRLEDHDPGIGVAYAKTEAGGWSEKYAPVEEDECGGVECEENYDPVFRYSSKMTNGEDALHATDEDEMGAHGELASGYKLKVDSTPPHGIVISGLGAGNEIGEGEYELKAEATDGTGSVKVAGIKSLAIAVDGREVGTANGSCAEALECKAKGEWAINGSEFGAGEHKLTVTATDNAGNVEKETYTLKVHHATPVPIGPGSVNPQLGEFSMSATDASIATPGASLTVTRTYRSRHLNAGAEGPLGPQWSLAVGGEESVTKQQNGNATLMALGGLETTFTSSGGKFVSPTGDANLTLVEEKNTKGETTELVLKNAADGDTSRFKSTTGPTATLWPLTKQEGPLAAQTVRYTFQTVEGVTEPVHAFAPEAAGVSCGEEVKALKAGCRVLTFEYAKETTAKGEKPSEWKAYKGRLKEVLYTAYNPASKEMATKPVADYLYDAQGRLRAEWNPEITPELKTTYGYEAEGRVTAVSPAGQEPWLLNYGLTSGEPAVTNPMPTRLLSVIRPAPASPAELKSQEEETLPANTVSPTLSSTKPAVGTKISVASEGTWSNAPLAYRYRWEVCNQGGSECVPIPGAVNQSYYPGKNEEGHTLRGQVIAYNADGAVVAASAATAMVTGGTPNSPAPEPPSVGTSAVWSVEYSVPLSGAELQTMTKAEVEKWGQTDDPVEAAAIFPPDSPEGWPAKTYARATVEYIDTAGRTVNTATPTGGVSTTEYNAYNDVVRTLTPDNRATAIKETCESKEKCKSAELAKSLSTENTYEEKGSEPGTELLSTLGPEHTVELTNATQAKAREHTVDSYNEGEPGSGGPYHLVTKSTQGAVVAGKEESESVRTTKTSYTGPGSQENLGWKLRKPLVVTTDPSGLDSVHTTEYSPSTGEPVESKMAAAAGKDAKVPQTYSLAFGSDGEGGGQFVGPEHDALDSHGDQWITDYGNNRIEELSAAGKFMLAVGWGVKDGKSEAETCTSECKAGISGSGKGQFSGPIGIAINQTNNDVYVADYGNSRIEELSSAGAWLASIGSKGTTGGEFSSPQGVAIDSSGDLWVADYANNRIQELSSSGTFMLAVGWGVKDGKSEAETCTSSCEAGISGSGNGQMAAPAALALSGGDVYVADYSNNRVDEFTTAGAYVSQFGSKGTATGDFEGPHDIATEAATGDLYVVDKGNNRVQKFSPAGGFLTAFGINGAGNGQLEHPDGMAITAGGTIYVLDSLADRVEEWVPTVAGNEGAHDTATIYYSSEANAEYKTCGEHAEWAGLACETKPVAQPESGLPELPHTTYTYNMWDELETTVETVGTKTRTKTDTYDAAGRPKTASTTSTEGTALPTITDEYSSESGALIKQCANEGKPCTEGKPKTITSVFNTLGQLTSYTDASEVTSTYEYDDDGRIHKTSDGKGTQTYTYSKTSGLPSELVDSAHEGMKFTATYDAEGNMLTEGYPNGMTAYYTYNPTGTTTGLEYKKLTDCIEEKEKCKWFTDAVVPSIHGQLLSQTSTFSKQAYTYDAAGRLTQVQNTPTGKDCTTRIYAYDEDTNRTSLTTREASSEKCATEGGTVESHTYDTADRLTDAGVTYNSFGDITSLPASDANGKTAAENLTSTYYVDNQLDTQTQNEQTIGYNLDPAGRTMETVSTGKKVADIISNYEGPGSAPSWTSNTSGETSRNIPGINGRLVAIQNNSEAPVLELANLHGDIIATASYAETATELASKADTSEFGVPTLSLPPKYSWLGAIELPTEELPSGAIDMGARSYVPEIGRFLQPDPIPGGSANAYAYTFGDPVNSSDPTGEFTFVAGYVDSFIDNWTAGAAAREAAREAAARAAAELAAREAAAAAAAAAGPQYEEEWGGEEEWEEWWEEEGGYEYASYNKGAEIGKQEAHVEPAILVQPLHEAAGEGGTKEGPGQEGPGNLVPVTCPNLSDPCGKQVKHHSGKANEGACKSRTNGQSCGAGGPGNAGDTCRTIAGATGPVAVMTGPGGVILWVIGFGTCSLN